MSPVEKPTQAEALKACPFCGSDRVTVWNIRDGQQAVCKDCRAQGAPAFNGPTSAYNRARDAWNRRLAADQAARTTTTEGERERFARLCEEEKVDAEATDHPEDWAYNRGCDDCAAAILATPPATPAGGGERDIDWAKIRAAVAKAAWPNPKLVDEAMTSIRSALSPSPDAAPAREAGE